MEWRQVLWGRSKAEVGQGTWSRQQRRQLSRAAGSMLGDFDGGGRIDFATTVYYTPGYFLCDDPRVLVLLNRMKPHAG
jgi:hypothetical protein